MRRIRKSACGYAPGTYTCQGIAALSPAFSSEDLVADDDMARTVSDASMIVGGVNYIDNYLNIPTKFAGMVMTIPYIPDMSADIVKAATANKQQPPELLCTYALDPVTFSNLLDLYTTIYQEETVINQDTEPSANTYLANRTLFDWVDTSGSSDEETVLYPSVLEPMLDTSFPPLDVGPLPTMELTLDGIVASLIMLTKWRIIVENILSGLLQNKYLKYVNSLRMALSTPSNDCGPNQFRILKSSANNAPESGWGIPSTSPQYTCTGGTAYINGQAFTVQGIDTPSPVGLLDGDTLNYYLLVEFSGTATGTSPWTAATGYGTITVTLTTAPSHDADSISIRIGGVRLTRQSGTASSKSFFVYKRDMARCMIDVDLVRTPSSGIILRDSNTYKVLGTAPCNQQE